ncbi:hypothetical protein B0T24DRAFT_389244 [Lasiosphaeria ovina]|uniref:Uncharacterized protein n=1 Tax=Lasiosphaeria ovina TaxID=92902 RepID=A0AAE0N243_9PEZI|nr:hypothetical protein B0T24DRAFT_389244 [Lasiosphaeria ovina]
MSTTLRNGTLKLEATADGEVVLLRRHLAGYFEGSSEVLALLEAKKQFTLIREGRPVVTDDVLGQMVGEALALRLLLSTAQLPLNHETIVIVMATRQYMRFLSFTIPDAYVMKVQSGDSDDEEEDVDAMDRDNGQDERNEDAITVRATNWLDLGVERCRQLACDNIAALVAWQLQSQ